jgi:hemoglobin-like flavoprotein
MTPEHEALVRQSWSRLAARQEPLAAAFYERLFEMDPRVRQLFAGVDMAQQRRKFMRMLDELVGALDAPSELVAQAIALGRRHVDYGALERDYDTVGAALIGAIEDELGEREFTPATREAWREAFALVAGLMRRGVERARTPA